MRLIRSSGVPTRYALLSKRDLSAVGDVAGEVRAMLGSDDLSLAKPEHIHRAIYDFLVPSISNVVEGMAAARGQIKKPGRRPAPSMQVPFKALDQTSEEPTRAVALEASRDGGKTFAGPMQDRLKAPAIALPTTKIHTRGVRPGLHATREKIELTTA